MMKIDKNKFKISKLKEMVKDKKGRAKLELSFYLIFFLIVILFAKFSSKVNTNINDSNEVASFINNIKDNYECNLEININNELYNYNIKVLGNNARIKFTNSDNEKNYYIMNNKYYEEDTNGNYILTTGEEVYPYINYHYLDINNIKKFINNSIKEDNKYKIKVADIILNSDSVDYVTISLDEEDKTIDIDYTNLFKEDDSIKNVNVKMEYNNINNIMSLDE